MSASEIGSRWTGVERPYVQDDVERIRGRFHATSSLPRATLGDALECQTSRQPLVASSHRIRRGTEQQLAAFEPKEPLLFGADVIGAPWCHSTHCAPRAIGTWRGKS